MLPKEHPARQTVYYYFRRRRASEHSVALNHKLRQKLCTAVGKQFDASAAIIDSQSVKTDEQTLTRGYDAGKKVKGRKRHIPVDALGLLLKAKASTADIQDRDGAEMLFSEIKEQMPRLQLVWADGGHRGKLILWVAAHCFRVIEIGKRNDREKVFKAVPKRWIVERTLSWLNRNRRLSKDYERKARSSEAFFIFQCQF